LTLSPRNKNLSLLLESVGETPDVVGEVALVAEELDVGTVDPDLALLALLDVLLAAEGSETPHLGDNDLLATGELGRLLVFCGPGGVNGRGENVPCTGNASEPRGQWRGGSPWYGQT
jgi:hypothetical protein